MPRFSTLSPMWSHVVRKALMFSAFMVAVLSAYDGFFGDGIDWVYLAFQFVFLSLSAGLLLGWIDWHSREQARFDREAKARTDEADRIGAA